jgi:hypothetical protein
MSPELSKLDNWVLNKIETEYRDDIQLLIGHNSYRLEQDAGLATSSFFFTDTEKGYGLAGTFIIDGVGYDLFPMSWERIGRMAELDEDNASCVGDATVLYYRNEGDRQRFLDMQARLQKHLEDPEFMVKKALEKVAVAMGLYQTMLFEDSLHRVRKNAGTILDFLANAVAYSSGTYFRHGYTDHMAELAAFSRKPDNFIKLYQSVVKAETAGDTKARCHEIIYTTMQFLNAIKGRAVKRWKEPDYRELASWYEELSYAWREVYHWCDRNEPMNAFMRGCFLQGELDIVSEEFGLEEFDMLGVFDANNLNACRERAQAIENRIVSLIEEQGVSIDRYDTIEQFLEKNE